jgi:hypothetical protein
MKWTTHKLPTVLFHALMGSMCVVSGLAAYENDLRPADLIGLCSSLTWLWLSWSTWKFGPPEHTKRKRSADITTEAYQPRRSPWTSTPPLND